MNVIYYIHVTFIVSCISILCKIPDKPIFKVESPFKKREIHFVYNREKFAQAIDETADFLHKIHLSKFVQFHVGLFAQYGVTVDDVQSTLDFVKEAIERSPDSMQDPVFLESNFNFYRWYVKSEHGHLLHGHYGPPDYIRTTSYLIAQISGSSVRTPEYTIPLYSVPTDEKLMTPTQAEQNKHHLLRYVYTRSEIVNGILENCPHIALLGWVSTEGYKELTLQGSAIITFEHEIKKLCRVAKHNDKKGEDKYYFFSFKDKSIDSKKTKFPVKPDPVAGITLAGNIEGLGLAKLMLLVSHNHGNQTLEGRFGLLTDTGEAFKDNYHQLDMFAGYFSHKKDFQQHILGLPHTAQLYVMIKKRAS